MTTLEIDDKLADLYQCDLDGDWTITLVDLVRECFNCCHAEVHPDGSVYIEEPQTGHYLDDEHRENLIEFLTDRGCFD